jgi:Flp pilus assembly CpaE family ATPase
VSPGHDAAGTNQDERGARVQGVTVLTAVGREPWAQRLVDQLAAGAREVAVAHRCADVEELLVMAATGVARAAVVSSYLEGLDGDVLARLDGLGLAVVGVTPSLDERGQRRLHQLGVGSVHASHEGPAALAAAVRRAVALRADGSPPTGFANPFAALPVPLPGAPEEDPEPGSGRVVAVWGPTGAPGRSTVAAGLAGELALLGWPTLLVDADVYGGSLAPALGLPDEASGLAAACRAANRGELDVPGLAALALEVAPRLRLLTGLGAAARWPEVRPAGVEVVLRLARTQAAVTVVDCGFALEQDEELSYDTLAPRRNGATLAVLAEADLVVAVGAADPLGLRRLVQGLAELAEAVPGVRTSVVVNRVAGADQERDARAVLRRFAGVEQVCLLPRDLASTDAAVAGARLLHHAAPEGPLRTALQAYAGSLVTRPAARPAGPLRRLLQR